MGTNEVMVQKLRTSTELQAVAKVENIEIAILYHKNETQLLDISMNAERITPATEDTAETRAYIGHCRVETDGTKSYHIPCNQCAVELTQIFKSVIEKIESSN